MSIPPAPTSAQPPEFAIASPDPVMEAALRQRIDAKTKPLGALGRVEELALRLGLIQGTTAPQITRATMVVFAADHGAAKAGISAYPQEVTWQMVENFLAGGAAINVFARRFGWRLRIVDAGVAHDFGARPGLEDAKIGAGTANYLESAAMSTAQRDRAIAAGASIATEVADSGATVIAFGEMGIGNTASASLLTHRLTGLPLAACIGRGTGLDDAGLARKQEMLAQAAARAPDCTEPLTVLAEFGGFEIAMMTGAFLAAAERRMTIVVDGFIVTAALLVAARLRPEVLEYCVFAHRSGEPGHHLQIEALGGRALLDLGLRLGEGTGAALALPLLEAACAMLAEMASFDSAGVVKREGSTP